MAEKISISQCMIVKDEEANIRRALSWGKGIVCEQIVVDTGSVDNTVMIAEAMGAKVFHFPWRDDFAAAKNYALDQASGNWIAFLDADEYFTQEDAAKIPRILERIEAQIPKGATWDRNIHVLRTEICHLNDEGKVFLIGKHDRIFRNMKELRYRNRIHEGLALEGGKMLYAASADGSLSIMHTGYRQSILKSKGMRNIPMLEKMVEEEPDNYDMWSYLGEAYMLHGRTDEAMGALEHTIRHGIGKANDLRLGAAFSNWFYNVVVEKENIDVSEEQVMEHYRLFLETGLTMPDVECFLGIHLVELGETDEGLRHLELSLSSLDSYRGMLPSKMAGKLEFVYATMSLLYYRKGKSDQAVRYGTLSLRLNRYQEQTLAIIIQSFREDANTTDSQIFSFLGKIYDLSGFKDKLFLIKTAIRLNYPEMESMARARLSDGEKAAMDAAGKKDWMVSRDELAGRYPQIPVQNRTDENFLYLMEEIQCSAEEELAKKSLDKEAAAMLKECRAECLWMYRELGDYQSRQCMYGLIEYWLHGDNRAMAVCGRHGLPFWEADLIPSAEGACYVDVGSGTLEAVKGFLYLYGEVYRDIQCFVQKQEGDGMDNLKKELSGFRDISVADTELKELRLDVEIKERLDIVRMESGISPMCLMEGCRRHIYEEHTKLAISLRGAREELWQAARMAKRWNPDYRLYLRYYVVGGAARVVLFAI